MTKKAKHRLTALLVLILIGFVALVYISPAFATSLADLAEKSTEHTNIGRNQADSDYFMNGSDKRNKYSSWEEPKERAFTVDADHSSRLESSYDTTRYPATYATVSGNEKQDIHCITNKSSHNEDGEVESDYWMKADKEFIFQLDNTSNCGVNLTYHNLYHYNPNDPNALKSKHAGYVPVDLKVKVTGWDYKEFKVGKTGKSHTSKPFISFSKNVIGLPAINMYNVGVANITYEYSYAAGPDAGKPYTLKANYTYNDIDFYQGIGVKEDSGQYFVSPDSKLWYSNLGGFNYFYGNIGMNINGEKHPEFAFGMTMDTTKEYMKYSSNQRKGKDPSPGNPDGAWTHFGVSAYSMMRPTAPKPNKSVSDNDNTTASWNGSKVTWGEGEDNETYLNGIGSPKTSWTYNVDQIVPGGMNSKWYYDKFQFDDDVSMLLKIKDVKVQVEGTDRTDWFDINIDKNNHVTASMKKNALKNDALYGVKSKRVRLKIKVALKRELTMQDFRGAVNKNGSKVLVADDRDYEGAIHIWNSAKTTISDRGKESNEITTTHSTDTYVKVPSIDDPYKRVTDRDEKLTEHNLVRFFDDEPFEYDIFQNVKYDQIHFDHFYIIDKMDPCIHDESSQSQIRVYDEKDVDRTDWFNIKLDHQTAEGNNRGLEYATVRADAKESILKDDKFYGHKFDLRWKNDLKSETKYKDQGIDQQWWEKEGHYFGNKDILKYPNKATRVIDEGTHDYPWYIQNGNKNVPIERQFRKDTNTVDTTIHLPHNEIDKYSDRYEYQVYRSPKIRSNDDIIHYTIKFKTTNPKPDGKGTANYVVVRDDDFPAGLTIDPNSYKVTGFNPKLEKPINSSEYGSLKRTEDEFGTYTPFTEGVNLTVNPNADTKNARYTIKTIKGKNGGDGFELKTRYIQYGEEITINFDAMADKTLNGQHVKNTAVYTSDGVPPVSDSEIVYINSPKMDVQKTVSEDVVDDNGQEIPPKEGDKKVYHTGDTINYKVVVKNINKGTFARNMTFKDEIMTFNGKTPGVNINSNSITVRDLNGNLYNRGSNAEGSTAGKGDFLVEDLMDTSGRTQTGFRLTFTKPNMGYYKDTSIPPVVKNGDSEAENPDAKINSHYDYEKDYKNLQLMKGYVITYSATVTDADLAGKSINNIAVSTPGENTNKEKIKNDPEIPSGKGEDEKNVPLDGHEPKLKITKDSDKRVYQLGETGHYRLTVTQPVEKATAEHVIIKDAFDITGMHIDKSSIKVAKNGIDITGKCGIDMVQTGFDVDNASNGKVYNGFLITPPDDKGKDGEPMSSLDHGDKYVVTYDVTFTSPTLVDTNIRNVARASSDNCNENKPKEPDPVTIGDGMTAVKSSDPMPGTIVKNGKVIKYTITVNNPTKEEKTNVMVRDQIPQHTTFYSSNDKDLEQVEPINDLDMSKIEDKEVDHSLINPLDIAGQKYFIAVIKSIPAGGSKTVSFKVRVNDDAKAEDIIHNVAEVHKATTTEVNSGANYSPHRVPLGQFATAHFDYTNAIDHPLRYWVEADNTVTIPGGNKPTDNPNRDIKKDVSEKTFKEGDQLHYSVVVPAKKDLVNPEIKDEITSGNAKINKDSIKVERISEGNIKDITKDVKIDANDTSYHITTKPLLGSYTLKAGDSIKVTYTATAEKSGSSIDNTAQTKDDNNPSWISDNAKVPPEGGNKDNPPEIKKSVKEDTYKSGDQLHYTVNVSAKRDLINPVIKDQIKDQKAKVNPDSIKVEWVQGNTATDITGNVRLTKETYGYQVETKPASGNYILKKGDIIRITYTATAGNVNGSIENTASTKDDHDPTWIDDTANVPPNKEQPQIKKDVSEKNYAPNDLLHYTVTVSAPKDLVNPEIKDEIKDQKAVIDASTIKVEEIKSNATYDITKNVKITSTDYGYHIVTKPSTGSYVLKKGDAIVVTYTAKVGNVKGDIVNTAQTKDDNNPSWISDEAKVPPTSDSHKPGLDIKKKVKETSYKGGETLHYNVDLVAKNGTVKNVVMKDIFNNSDIRYNAKSIKVLLEGKDITGGCDISIEKNHMRINTHKDLRKGEKIVVTYVATAPKSEVGTLKNTAIGSGDNVDPVKDETKAPPYNPNDPNALKSKHVVKLKTL